MLTPIITRNSNGTYHARVPDTPYKCTCTGGEQLAAENLIEKFYGREVVASLAKDPKVSRFPDLKRPKSPHTVWSITETSPLILPERPKKAPPAVTVTAEVQTTEQIATDAFAGVRELDDSAQQSAAMAVAFAILAGMELATLQKRFGYTRGRPSKNALPKPANTWEECVEQYYGRSKMTAWRYMKAADEAKSRIPKLKALKGKSLSDITPEERTDLLKAVSKSVDGSTLNELLMDWGVVKMPKQIGGSKKPEKEDVEPDPVAQARILVSYPISELKQAMANPEKFTRALWEIPEPERKELQTNLASALDAITETLKKAS